MVCNERAFRIVCLVACGWLGAASAAQADPLIAEGQFPALDQQMHRQGRQFYQLNARPFGLSLDGHVEDEEARHLIDQFLAQDGSDDVEAVTGRHPYEILSSYGEHGDLGFFGGIAVAATAYEYLTLQRDGATAADLERARARVVHAAESWHVFYVVTGGGGIVARGIRRTVPENSNDPPLPGTYPELVPLFDPSGAPLPQPKNNGTDRADNSAGALPEGVWVWSDSCSKDQLVGQVFGMVALYDAMKDDPQFDPSMVARMQDDARRVGEMLMAPRDIELLEGPVGQGIYDLIIMDADGRPTFHHDLNPLSLEKIYLDATSTAFNRFNLLMAIGVLEGLHHVSGDERLERYLYDELLYQRDLLDKINREQGAIDYVYMGRNTNFDDPDMTAIALWLGLYLEKDPTVAEALRAYLEHGWWNREGESHTAARCKQPLWHAIYLTLTAEGADAALVDELADLLVGFQLGPYWNDARINCDEAELAAGECVAVDGTTTITVDGQNDGGEWMATEALDPAIRPPSNFDARSNPFAVNGGGGLRLNPGGDLLAAYWIARYMQAQPPGQANRSPNARDHAAVGPWPVDPLLEPRGGGCGCRTAGPRPARSTWPWLVPLLAAAVRRRASGHPATAVRKPSACWRAC